MWGGCERHDPNWDSMLRRREREDFLEGIVVCGRKIKNIEGCDRRVERHIIRNWGSMFSMVRLSGIRMPRSDAGSVVMIYTHSVELVG